AEADAAAKKKEGAQGATDDKLLQDYFKTKKITNVKKTASGMYYTVTKPGSGLAPKNGQQVSVNYTGVTLKGEKFDSNTDPSFGHVEPFTFQLGKRNVIRGWDEAVALMKKGMKATFYIPSPLAYGANGPDKIGPNAILIFDIELLSFK
ncbi:MAG: peptidylprolyl isomerase, partial [Chitinophagaceae bacterium]